MNKKGKVTVICILIGIISICVANIFINKNVEQKPNNIEFYEMQEQEIKNLQTMQVEEQNTTQEQELENESLEQQGEISYNGTKELPNIKLGNYKGLTYYSQIDSRWKNHVYTSTGKNSQTIGNSGCGPAVAAMVVTATTGTITPPDMGDIFVQNGYRSANNGTYWAAFPWIADVFNIKYQETSNFDKALELIKDNNYVVVPCGSGLFTYGGHYILITGIEGNNLKIYDPYLYSTKFNTSSRNGKVEVKGNTVYCSIDNFKKYAHARSFFAFKNNGNTNTNSTTLNTISNNLVQTSTNQNSQTYNVTITAKSGLRIRSGASTNYKRLGAYSYGTNVEIIEQSNGWGKTKDGWIYLRYTKDTYSTNKTTTTNNITAQYKTGTYKVNCSRLNVRTGPGTNYRVKILSQLTASARKQGGYVRGVICTVKEINGNWGKTPSGWICLNYCVRIR